MVAWPDRKDTHMLLLRVVLRRLGRHQMLPQSAGPLADGTSAYRKAPSCRDGAFHLLLDLRERAPLSGELQSFVGGRARRVLEGGDAEHV
jgi:hypothetical protein